MNELTEEHYRLADAALTGHVREEGIRVGVAEAIARAEEHGRRRAADVFAALFSGGPDTSCRTTWREDPSRPECSAAAEECVEVPMADLRQAFVDAGEVEA